MHIRSRPYNAPADLARMQHLVVVGARANAGGSYMHPGCLSWETQNPPDEDENRRNIWLWERVDFADPELVAFAITLRHERSFDLFVHPAFYGAPQQVAIVDEYLAWAEATARERGIGQLWPFWLMDYDVVLTRLLVERGFVVQPVPVPPPLFERALDDLPPINLPNGYTMHSVSNLEEGRLRAAVTYGAFGLTEDWESFAGKYARFMQSPEYAGERDLFVRSPEGRGASGCTLWFDLVNAVGLFEPVVTHPDFQSNGLGKAVMAEGLRRMRAAGMRRAILGFDPDNVAARKLYESLGFAASCYFVVCHKNVALPKPTAPASE